MIGSVRSYNLASKLKLMLDAGYTDTGLLQQSALHENEDKFVKQCLRVNFCADSTFIRTKIIPTIYKLLFKLVDFLIKTILVDFHSVCWNVFKALLAMKT